MAYRRIINSSHLLAALTLPAAMACRRHIRCSGGLCPAATTAVAQQYSRRSEAECCRDVKRKTRARSHEGQPAAEVDQMARRFAEGAMVPGEKNEREVDFCHQQQQEAAAH